MTDPVKMIPLKSEKFSNGIERYLRKCIMSANCMKIKIESHQKIGIVGKSDPVPEEQDQPGCNQDPDRIFRDPDHTGNRCNAKKNEFDQIDPQKKMGKTGMEKLSHNINLQNEKKFLKDYHSTQQNICQTEIRSKKMKKKENPI